MRLEINTLKSVNRPFSIHGIYPYRGKISSVEASMIISQLPKGSSLLDPFCGSGTILFEGLLNNLEVYGIDNNPLAYIIASGKMDSLKTNKEKVLAETETIISKAKKDIPELMCDEARKHFHKKTAQEIISLVPYFPEMSQYLKVAFVGAIALSARACNHYKWTSSTVGKDINPKREIDFYEKFLEKVNKHHPDGEINNGKSKVILGDSREISKFISEKSIDFVFTSPPYFDCLDYTSYYGKIVLNILGYNRIKIKKELIQNTKTYKEDMKKVLNEIDRVTKDNAIIIFVVGDKKIGQKIIKGSEIFSEMFEHKPNKIIEREYTNSSSQVFDKLNKTKRKEQIIIWDKKTW